MRVTTRRRQAVVAALSAVALFGATACSDDGGDDPGTEANGGPVTLVLQTFGDFYLDDAIAQFEADNENITVEHQELGELRDYTPQLTQWLAAGSGAGDVVALEEGIILQYVQNSAPFVDLLEHGAGELEGNFLPWVWQRGTAADGKLIGLGSDVGGLAMCYRADLFEEAGLPSDRDEVAQMWTTWDDYLAAGRQFRDSGAEAKWLDASNGIVQPYVMQNSDVFFYNAEDEFIGDSNPVFQEAWDFGLGMAEEDLTAGILTWSEDWTAGFQNSAFATRPCPAWMTGLIKDWAGEDNSGNWDITVIPGGGGNWGGSHFGVPAQSDNPAEAAELAKFLSSPEAQLLSFEAGNRMPSSPQALEDPRFTEFTDPYFRDAPVGAIIAETVTGLQPVYLGSRHQATWETVFEPAMQRVEAGEQSSEDAFADAVAEAQQLQ